MSVREEHSSMSEVECDQVEWYLAYELAEEVHSYLPAAGVVLDSLARHTWRGGETGGATQRVGGSTEVDALLDVYTLASTDLETLDIEGLDEWVNRARPIARERAEHAGATPLPMALLD